MVQYYTLEQAARLLQTTPEKLRDLVKQGKVRAFQDRGTLRFRSQEIDELARSQGVGSDPGLPLADTSKPPSSGRRKSKVTAPSEEGSDDFDFNLSIDEDPNVPLGGPPSGKGKNTPSSAGKRNTPPSKPSKVNPTAKASDSDVRLVPENSEMDFELTIDDPPAARSPVPKPRQSRIAPETPKSDSDVRLEQPTPGSDSDVKIVPDDSDTDNEAVPLGQNRAKTPSDSDIRMELDEGHGPSAKRPGSDPMVTEEIDLDLEEAPKGSPKSKPPSSKKTKGKQTRPPASPADLPTSSPFELSEEDAPPVDTSKKGNELEDSSSDFDLSLDGSDKEGNELEDSSSDFELSLDGSDSGLEVDSDETPKLNLDEEEVSLGEADDSAEASGINLEAPADSGISLEADGSDEMEFELSLDDGGSGATPKPRSGKSVSDSDENSEFELSLDDSGTEAPLGDSDSEFELTLDDSGSSDLALEETDSASDSEFELTLDEEGGLAPLEESGELANEDNNLFESDFDVPSLDDESASEAVALEDSSSDFDLAVDDSVVMETGESESQVVPLPEDEADESAETVNRPARKSKLAPGEGLDESGLDLDLETSGEAATEGEEETEGEEDQEGVARPRGAPVYVESPPAEWGVAPALMLLPCVIVLFVVGLMSYELIQGMWGYHKGTPVSSMVVDPISRQVGSWFDITLPKE